MHEKLIKQLRNAEHCSGCPYDEDCNEFDSCLMDLLAADAIEDMNKRIVRQEKELEELKSTTRFREIKIISTDIPKPLKVVFEDGFKIIQTTDDIFEVIKKLTTTQAKQLVVDIFGTTNIGALDCSDIKEDLYYCPTCQRILELTEIDSCMNTPNEIIDYCLECQSEVINLKDNT